MALIGMVVRSKIGVEGLNHIKGERGFGLCNGEVAGHRRAQNNARKVVVRASAD